MGDGCPHSSSDPEQLHVIADRLTLDDAPSCQTPVQQTLNAAINTAEVSALPVPLLVTAPVPPELQRAQSEPETPSTPILPGLIEPTTDEERAEREYHLTFMREALEMGDLALKTNETPVGCVLVYKGRTIARGMNATNITRNGTRHAEFMALSALLSRRELGDVRMANNNPDLDDASWGDVDPKDGHIYPYGQKLHPAPIVNRSIISDCVLYVTVEPCVMCASLLRQLGIKKVYFGAVNDKFGGTGGVFRVHMNSKPVVLPKDRPYQLGYGPQDLHLISKGRAVALPRDEDDGDGGNVESGYPVEGGYLRDDAVSLLRRFYVQENGRAPQPRKKEGRAARLYAALGVGATETGAAETGAAETDAAETGAAETGAMESATINTATIETNTVKAVNMETKNGAADAPDLYDNSTETLVDADPLTHGS
ncbi:cytidine deaminase-like protein [Xylaria sp. CBS 124048]|nr:cytidine deaminase-like protein [Xylaria sp. CBS 124048]